MDAAQRAAHRMAFQLTYARSGEKRRFEPGILTGPNIPCAYGGELNASGEWNDGDDLSLNEERVHGPHRRRLDRPVRQLRGQRAVHEALEWLRVDGAPWLDPHGEAMREIYAAVGRLVDELDEIRRRHATGRSTSGNV